MILIFELISNKFELILRIFNNLTDVVIRNLLVDSNPYLIIDLESFKKYKIIYGFEYIFHSVVSL